MFTINIIRSGSVKALRYSCMLLLCRGGSIKYTAMRLEILCPSVNIILIFVMLHFVDSVPRNSNTGKHQVEPRNLIISSNKTEPAIFARQADTRGEHKLMSGVVKSEDLKLPMGQGFEKNDETGKVNLLTNIQQKTVPASEVSDVQDKVAMQWPLGVISYLVDRNTYDVPTIKQIVKMMGVVESASCLMFSELDQKPEGHEFSWLHITNPDKKRECVHKVSNRVNGENLVVLGFECLHPSEILHSILHGIGFKDEVAHPHRDQYIRVQWENIQPKYRSLYSIQFEDAPYRLVEYDPMSIMHFHDRAFSSNGAATIVPLIFGLQINPSDTLSPLDSMKLKLAFGHECNKRKVDDLLDTCKNALLGKEDHSSSSTSTEEYSKKRLSNEHSEKSTSDDTSEEPEETNSDDIEEIKGETANKPVGKHDKKNAVDRIPDRFRPG